MILNLQWINLIHFFNYLCLPTIKLGESIFNNVNTNKILLSCSGGLTTSYFAYSMQEIFKRQGLDIVVDAVGYMEIDKVIDDYDMVLLAPQVAYLLPQLKINMEIRFLLLIR